jgi:hypothetical protein
VGQGGHRSVPLIPPPDSHNRRRVHHGGYASCSPIQPAATSIPEPLDGVDRHEFTVPQDVDAVEDLAGISGEKTK